MMLIGLHKWIMKMKTNAKKMPMKTKSTKTVKKDIELEEAKNIDPGEIDNIIDDEANPNEHQDARVHQDDGDHQESEENIGIEELSREEPGVPSESETYEPLDPPDNESDTVTSRVGHPTWMQNKRKSL